MPKKTPPKAPKSSPQLPRSTNKRLQNLNKAPKKKLKQGPRNVPLNDSDERAANKLSPIMVQRYVQQLFMLTPDELKERVRIGGISVFEVAIINMLLTAAISADQYRLDFLFNRSIGKVPDKIDVTTQNKYASWTDEQLLKEKKRLDAINRVRLSHVEDELGIERLPVSTDAKT
jgi:hypothetical protein